MASSSTRKPSSSSAPTGKFNFDVFLSFRGEDTRYNFTDHLFENLKRMGINTFRDDGLERGEEIAQLTKIMECKKEMDQIVLPVFYHVHPSDVRKQTGSFGKAFAKHGTTVDEEKVKRWRAAMTEASSLSGWHVIKDYEEQLESLVGSRNWFGAGTTIIVTTRDQHLLRIYGVDDPYEVRKLHYMEAIQLFSKHAFKQNAPKENYVNLLKCIVDYARAFL
ncbi:hypothetical protein AAG906_000483 [Vitis piasezkii]